MDTQTQRWQQTTLQKMLDDYGTQSAIAEAFAVSQPLVNQWFSGARNISRKTAERIERMSEGRYRAVDLVFGR